MASCIPLFMSAILLGQVAPAGADLLQSLPRNYTLPQAGGAITLRILPGPLAASDEQLSVWIGTAGKAVTNYLGQFPLPHPRVVLHPGPGRGVSHGVTRGVDGGMIRINVGKETIMKGLRRDWVATHEMFHLAFPDLMGEHRWAEEGFSTYAEPIARIRIGELEPERVWGDLVRDMPQGLPGPGDRGLDRTPTWGRTYWGGAIFYLLADIDIRRQSAGRFGLEHAVAGMNRAGGNVVADWTITRAFETGDRATGTQVLQTLYAQMKDTPHPVDLAALWRELGVIPSGETVTFDESAQLASVRRAITWGKDSPKGSATQGSPAPHSPVQDSPAPGSETTGSPAPGSATQVLPAKGSPGPSR